MGRVMDEWIMMVSIRIDQISVALFVVGVAIIILSAWVAFLAITLHRVKSIAPEKRL